MFDEVVQLEMSDLPKLMKLVNSIYENLSMEELADKGYPDLRFTPPITDKPNTFELRKNKYPLLQDTNADLAARTEFFSRSLVTNTGIPKKLVFGITDDNGELVTAMAVTLSDYWPVWVVSWILNSPNHESAIGPNHKKLLYNVIELYKSYDIHETIWVLPKTRLRAWKKIKQATQKIITDRGFQLYESEYITDYIVPANTVPEYSFMLNLLGNRSHPYDMCIRRIRFK
jgi:hypothetical protein